MPPHEITNARADDVPRWVYLLACLVVIPLGLGSRRFAESLPEIIATYGGDTMWALFFYFLIRALRPQSSLVVSAAACLVFSVLIEVSQLYHAPWLTPIRETLFGQLVLGEGFLWSDLVCYSVGVALGVTFDVVLHSLRSPRPNGE